MRVGLKLAIGFFVVILCIWATFFFAGNTYRMILEKVAPLEEDVVPSAIAMAEMDKAAIEIAHEVMEYIVYGEEEDKEKIQTIMEDIKKHGLIHLEHETHIGHEEQKAAEEIMALIDGLNSQVVEIINLKKQGVRVDELLKREKETVHPVMFPLIEQLNEHKSVHMGELAEAIEASHEAHKSGVQFLLLASGFVTLVAAAVSFFITRSIVNPLHALHKGAELIGQGNFDYKVGTNAKDEIGQLSRAFDRMTENLGRSTVSIKNLEKEITEIKKAEDEKEKLLYNLGERVKELNCLYGLSKIVEQPAISLEEIFENMIYLIPPGWQYPDITCARVIFENKKYKTDNFKKTRWKQSVDIKVYGKKAGIIEVYYLEERPELDEGPFLKGERNLIDALAERLSDIAEGKKTASERNNLTSRLHETTRELNTIIESVGDAILTTDDNYSIIVVNKALSEMLGLPEDEIAGKQCSEVLTCRDEKGNIICEKECGLKQTIKKDTTSVTRTFIQNTEGIPITIESINSPLKSDDGSIIGAVKAIRDVTKEAEVDRMKTEFISTVSHELRTPLTPIQGYINLILDGDTGEINDIQREFLDLVSQNTERLSMLINDLLDIEKIESGKVSLHMQHVSFSELVRDAAKTMEPQAEKKGLDLITDIRDGIESYVDPDWFMQILLNLLTNAIKFTLEGSVTVRLQAHGGKAEISVCDTGIGIKASDQKKLFTKFFRAEDAHTRKAGGTGLGLSIVKALVEMHKGEIIVKSTLQKGSEFKVILPLKLKKTKKTNN